MQKQASSKLQVRWVHSEANLADAMTKTASDAVLQRFFHNQHVWTIMFDTVLSSKRRRAAGLQPLDGGADLQEGLRAFFQGWVP